MVVAYSNLAEVLREIVCSFKVQDLEVVALKWVVELEGVIVEHQYFG